MKKNTTNVNAKKFSYGKEFQIDLLTMCINNVSFLLLCKKYVKPDFFTDEKLKNFIERSYKYFDKYQQLPDKTFFKSISKDNKEKILIRKIFNNRVIREQYIREKTEDFVRKSLFIDYYVESGKLYNKNPENPDIAFDFMYEGMKDVNTINMNSDQFHFLYKDFEKRLSDREHKINTQQTFKIKTGIKELDLPLKGGAGGGEVWMLMGDAKSGKSLGLIHIGNQAVKRFVPVLHFQLEGKIDETLDRYDASYLGAKYDDVVKNQIPDNLLQLMHRTSSRRDKRDLIVRGYSDWDTCTILDIERDYLELLNKGYRFKVVIIDYMDLMKSRKNYSDERFRQQSIIRDLKTFAVKYNVVVWTATQANRGSEETRNDPNYVLTSKNLSEDYGKVRAIDGLITINCTDEEYSNGICRLWLDQARSTKGKRLIRIRRALDRCLFYIPKSKYNLFNIKVPIKKTVKEKKKNIKKNKVNK